MRGESEKASKRCENALKVKNDEPSRVSDRGCFFFVISAFKPGINLSSAELGESSQTADTDLILLFFAACGELRRFSYKSRMRTLMRSTLLIFYENAAALLNFLNLGFSEPEAVQFNFSLLLFSSLSPSPSQKRKFH